MTFELLNTHYGMIFYAAMWFVCAVGMNECMIYHFKYSDTVKEKDRERPTPKYMIFFFAAFWGITIPLIVLCLACYVLARIYRGETFGDDDDFEL